MHSLYPLIMACRYSYEPNKLSYCGPAGAFPIFKDFIHDPMAEKMQRIEQLLKGFYGAYAYQELIARSNSLEPFSKDVIEAYWLGNNLLENAGSTELKEIILKEFTKPGLLPKKIAERLAESTPANTVPHHSFHVLHVNFITPKVEKIIKNIDACLIKWAEIKQIEQDSLLVKGVMLFREGGELKIREKEKRISKGFAYNPKPGDYVTEHWNSAVEVINKEKLKSLKKYTERNLKAVNSG